MKPPTCDNCPCLSHGQDFSAVEVGPLYERTRLLLVGEASGQREAQDGLPFRPWGQAGSLLADTLINVKISRREVAITNVLRCRPKNDWLDGAPWERDAKAQCITSHLTPAIAELKPRVILALGGTAFRALTDAPKGRYGTLDYIRGYALAGVGPAKGAIVIPTYHPAFLRRGSSHLIPLLRRDLLRAYQIAVGKLKNGVDYTLDPLSLDIDYTTTTTLEEARLWLKGMDPALPLFFDIETPRTTREDEDERTSFADRDINLFQCTQKRGRGIAIPYRGEFKEVVADILAHPVSGRVGHNSWAFDDPVLASNGLSITSDDDTMVMMGFWWSDLPRNLQATAQMAGFPFPWKHLGETEKEWYGCADVDATAWSYYYLRNQIEQAGAWDSYRKYFSEVWPILRDMSVRGIPIAEVARIALGESLDNHKQRLTGEIQQHVPPSVFPHKQKNGLKTIMRLKCESCEYEGKGDHICGTEIVPYRVLADLHGYDRIIVEIKEDERCQCTKAVREECPACNGTGIVRAGSVIERWALTLAFNPNSWQQVRKLIKALGHPVPKHAKRTTASGEAAETTEDKEIERLWIKTKHPIYPLLRQYRQITKTRGTYVEGWRPGGDGRIHTTYTFQTATWQLSSRGPNTQNGIKHGKTEFQKDIAQRFNEMQWAEPDHTIVDFDCKSFHALTTAHDFNIPRYARLARIDIHSFLTCHYLKLSEADGLWDRPDEEMKDLFKRLKKDEKFSFTRDYKAKRCIAESELVLTDRGLVPIQNILLTDRVWDGVEWVHHDGLIYQGVREVITYEGLTATPDHKIITEDGREMALGEAASQMVRLHNTGAKGNPIRSRHRDKLEAIARRRNRESEDEMYNVRAEEHGGLLLFEIGPREWVPPVWANQVAASGGAREAIRCDYGALLFPPLPHLQTLRGAWNTVRVWVEERIRSIRSEGASTRELSGGGDRSGGQQRPLRSWESPARNAPTEYGESAQYGAYSMEGTERVSSELPQSIQLLMDGQASKAGVNGGGDYRKTYDLLNAGPRRCFTVSGKLVFNCILGIQFAMGYRKLYQLHAEDFENEAESRKLWELVMVHLFPELAIGQESMRARAAEDGELINKFGAIRHFFDVRRFDRTSQKYVNGDQAEAAVAFLPSSHAHGHMRDMMLRIRERGWDDRYELINCIHDSFRFHCPTPLREECISNIKAEMERPSSVLIYPEMAPNGLWVEVEAKAGRSVGEMEKV